MSNILVEVAYATPNKQLIIALEVASGSKVADVINQSSILEHFPEINLTHQKVGIFSNLCELTDKVKAGDRIEIYRPLLIDPKEARRLRAEKSPKAPRQKNV